MAPACAVISAGGSVRRSSTLIAIGDVRPFDEFWVRLAIVVLIVAVAALLVYLDIRRRRQASAEIEKAVTAASEPEGDASVLQEKMRDALATLRRAKGKGGDVLYDLPWYVIIGPPGAGKTTALINSGLKFPLARGGTPEAIAGVGGTRYCDWWFTEEAVLIDTAGRYTTQDSDPKGDRKSWLSFLDLLKRRSSGNATRAAGVETAWPGNSLTKPSLPSGPMCWSGMASMCRSPS